MEVSQAASTATRPARLPTHFGLLALLLIGGLGTGAGFGFAWASQRTLDWLGGLFVDAAPPPVAATETFAPLFVDWPDNKPDLALALTGEMFGYLRPCGCSPGQHGGLARRGGLIEFLKEDKGWNTLPLDLGDLIEKSTAWESLRYHYALESLQALGYPVIGLGTKDLAISVTEVLGHALNAPGTAIVDANLMHTDPDFQSLLDEGFKRLVVLEQGGVKIAVSEVMSDSLAAGLPDPTVTVASSLAVVQEVLPQMNDAGAELKVLFAHMPFAEAVALAEAVPGVDLILCRSKYEDSLDSEARFVGRTLVTWVGQKGKKVGVVGYWRDGSPRLRFELVPVDLRFTDTERMNELYARYVAAVKSGQFLEKLPRVSHPSRDTYAGAESCAACHKRAYAKWKTTGHAHALETLTRKATPPGQDFNPECVVCHATGMSYSGGFVTAFAGGFVTPDQTPHLGGNQCENCHGPGKAHVDNPKDTELALRLRKSEHQIESECRKCHDVENSPRFDFKTYWEKVKHPWRD